MTVDMDRLWALQTLSRHSDRAKKECNELWMEYFKENGVGQYDEH